MQNLEHIVEMFETDSEFIKDWTSDPKQALKNIQQKTLETSSQVGKVLIDLLSGKHLVSQKKLFAA